MKRIVASVFLAVFLLLGLSMPVFAQDAPDSLSITASSVKAFRNLVETGDFAVVFHWKAFYADYTTLTVPGSDSIVLRLYSANGTLMATSYPYVFSPFETYGYGDGISAFYFPASANTTWLQAYEINIAGLPAYFSPIPTPVNYTMVNNDYSTATTQAEARSDFYNTIIGLCNDFNTIYPDHSLKASTDSGVVLSSDGETYFRGAIPGIQSMCPQLFLVQVYTPTAMTIVPYNTTLADAYTARLEGTDVMRGLDRIGTAMGGVDGMVIVGVLLFLLCIALCIFCMIKGWGLEPGLIGSGGIMITGALLVGDFVFTLVMIGGFISAMGIMYVMVFKRA